MSADRYAYLPTMVVVPYASALFARVLHAIDPAECSEPESEEHHEVKAIACAADKKKNAVVKPKRRPAVAIVTCVLLGTLANMSANLLDTWRNEPTAFQHNLR